MASSGKAFFRIILPTILQQNKMSLPSQFMAAYGDELPSEAKLVVPNGHVWQVQLTKENDEVTFHDGLTEFLQHYSICYGHLLVFEYMGSGTFSVRIFDNTTCEIQYTIAAPQNEEDGVEEEEVSSDEEYTEGQGEEVEDLESDDEETDESVEILGSDSPQRSRSRRAFPSANVEWVHKDDEIIVGQFFKHTLSKFSQKTKTSVEAARNAKLTNPSFMVIIQKSNINFNIMTVPSVFAKKYLKLDHTKVKIKNADNGREWITRKSYHYKNPFVLEGCLKFYHDSDLKGGDVCVFELVRVPDVVLKFYKF
ncbi:B3 domain-containing transcription factor VRN1 [Euphorbia peplus]|nr:B3 domain-containing transcription factor VRN1 [Euphorbia peplus]